MARTTTCGGTSGGCTKAETLLFLGAAPHQTRWGASVAECATVCTNDWVRGAFPSLRTRPLRTIPAPLPQACAGFDWDATDERCYYRGSTLCARKRVADRTCYTRNSEAIPGAVLGLAPGASPAGVETPYSHYLGLLSAPSALADEPPTTEAVDPALDRAVSKSATTSLNEQLPPASSAAIATLSPSVASSTPSLPAVSATASVARLEGTTARIDTAPDHLAADHSAAAAAPPTANTAAAATASSVDSPAAGLAAPVEAAPSATTAAPTAPSAESAPAESDSRTIEYAAAEAMASWLMLVAGAIALVLSCCYQLCACTGMHSRSYRDVGGESEGDDSESDYEDVQRRRRNKARPLRRPSDGGRQNRGWCARLIALLNPTR